MKYFLLIMILITISYAGEDDIVKSEEMGIYPPIYKKIGYNIYLIKKQQQELKELYKKINKIKKENMLMELQANHILLSIKNLPLVEIIGLKADSLELQGEQALDELLSESNLLESKEVDNIQKK